MGSLNSLFYVILFFLQLAVVPLDRSSFQLQSPLAWPGPPCPLLPWLYEPVTRGVCVDPHVTLFGKVVVPIEIPPLWHHQMCHTHSFESLRCGLYDVSDMSGISHDTHLTHVHVAGEPQFACPLPMFFVVRDNISGAESQRWRDEYTYRPPGHAFNRAHYRPNPIRAIVQSTVKRFQLLLAVAQPRVLRFWTDHLHPGAFSKTHGRDPVSFITILFL